VQFGSFVNGELVSTDDEHFHLGAIRQVGRLVDDDAAVLHLGFQRVLTA
jgi:hypothetical protein